MGLLFIDFTFITVNGIANFLILLNQVTEIPFNNFLYCWNKS
ncbi:hypothetical protein F383_16719 [Gossypium arboreum]|uniref:Uncharacterized protein n=1 Tax=Gossypium arboreum TaxID=29729 RepID=A0A0B0NMA2_GOSAR|nr:hypothetical protein F383_16719 [Gossypium arboreum]